MKRRHTYGQFSWHLRVVIQERAHVDHATPWLQHLVDELQVLDHVAGSVEEETTGHTVPLTLTAQKYIVHE